MPFRYDPARAEEYRFRWTTVQRRVAAGAGLFHGMPSGYDPARAQSGASRGILLPLDNNPAGVFKEGDPLTTRWRPDFDPSHLYFVTTSTAGRVPVFQREVMLRTVMDALYFVGLMNQIKLYAFVVMPNHVHAVVQYPEECPLTDWVRALKAAVSRLVIRQYQVEGDDAALSALRVAVRHPKKQRYKVWEDGYLAKDLFTPEVLRQKVEYIHSNPVQERWGLARAPEEYVWSSARFYLLDEPAVIPVQDVRELLV